MMRTTRRGDEDKDWGHLEDDGDRAKEDEERWSLWWCCCCRCWPIPIHAGMLTEIVYLCNQVATDRIRHRPRGARAQQHAGQRLLSSHTVGLFRGGWNSL
jgi:hypothetical protein